MAYRLSFMSVKDMASAGNPAGAIARLTEMVPSAPSSIRPELFFWKAALHEQMGNHGEAIGDYDLILRLYPQSFHATLASTRWPTRLSAASPPDTKRLGHRPRPFWRRVDSTTPGSSSRT